MIWMLPLICAMSAAAQPSEQRAPLDVAIQRVWQAQNSGHFDEAIAGREQARVLLQSASVASPQFTGWAQQVAQLYTNAGLNGLQREILQGALARTASLPDWHAAHLAMLNALAYAWEQDGNLLKAVKLLEQASSAEASAPAVNATQLGTFGAVVSGPRSLCGIWYGGPSSGEAIDARLRLASLYRRLGWKDNASAVESKVRSLASKDDSRLANYYQQYGQVDDAAAIYKRLAEESPDSQIQGSCWGTLATLYSGKQRYPEAIAAWRQAIAAVESSDQSSVRGQATSLRLNMAEAMRAAGSLDQADEVYRRALLESRNGPQATQTAISYAQYLTNTQRSAQAESFLREYLASGSVVEPQQKINLLYQLAHIAQETKQADEYRKAAAAMQPPAPAQAQPARSLVQDAQAAMSQDRWDDAYTAYLRWIDSVPDAEMQSIIWAVPDGANRLAAHRETAKAERLFQRAIARAQDSTAHSSQWLLQTMSAHVRFLMNQPELVNEASFAIEQLRGALIEANSANSGTLIEPAQMKMNLARSQSEWPQAEAFAQELLGLQASLSGKTSDMYLAKLQAAAPVYEAAGDFAQALTLRRAAIPIADLFETNNKLFRPQARMDAALDLAHLGQFEEADSQAQEAISLLPSNQTGNLDFQLNQIRQLKQAAAAARASRINQ